MALAFIKPASGVAINKPLTGTTTEIFPIRVTNTTSASVTWNPTCAFTSNATGLTITPQNTGRVIGVGETAVVGFSLTASPTIAGSLPPTIAVLEIEQVTADGTDTTTLNVYLTAYTQEDSDINDNTARYEIDKGRLPYEALAKSQHEAGYGMYIFTNQHGNLEHWPDTGGGSGGSETWPANTKFVSPSWRNRTPDSNGDYYDPIYSTPAKALAAIKATVGYETQDWTIIVYNRANTSYPSETLELDHTIRLVMVDNAVYNGTVILKDKSSISGDGNFTGTVRCNNNDPLAATYGVNFIDAQFINLLQIQNKAIAQVNVRTTGDVQYSSTYANHDLNFYSILEVQKAKTIVINGLGCCILQNCLVRPDTAIACITFTSGNNNFYIQNCTLVTEYAEAIVTTDAGGADLHCIGNSTVQAEERKFKVSPHYTDYTITQKGGSIEFVKTLFLTS